MIGLIALALAATPAIVAKDDGDVLLDVRQPSVVASAIQKAGYRAELKTNKQGDPYIASAANGADFTVEFYGCDAGKDCNSFQFYSWYKKDPIFTSAFLNEWNAGKRFLKVAIDSDGDLSLYMDVTAIGKMTYANFADALDWYSTMDGEFSKFLSEKRAAEKVADKK